MLANLIAQYLGHIDLPQVIDYLREIVGGGSGVFLATQILKWIPAVPVNQGQKTRIRAVAAILSAISVALIGWTDGNLTPDSVQQVLVAVLTLAGTWATSHGMYKASKAIGGDQG